MIFVVFTTFLLLAAVPGAYACDCFEMPSNREEFNKSKAVFIGEVVKVETPNVELIAQLPEGLRNQAGDRIELRVIRSWKGDRGRMVVWSHATHILCARWNFKVGEQYLIYARKFRNILIGAEFCSRTRPLEVSDAEKEAEMVQLNGFRKSKAYE